jgi:predicted cupin superfamily sugar epimerase
VYRITVLINQSPNLTSIIERLIHKDTLQSEYISPQRLIISTDTRKKLTASDYKNILQLEKHIEGGYFKVCYTSEDEVIPLDDRYRANEPQINIHDNKRMSLSIEKRSAGSFIYFMLEHQDFSAWHRLKSDEIWHYYDGGSPIDIHTIDPDGALQTHTLGNPEMTDYASFQVVITAGRWFSAEVRDKLSFGLVGCTVSPGFEYKDFELANKKDLVAKFPKHSAIINRLTHAKPNHSNALTTQAIKYAVVALVAGVGLFSIFKENTFLNNCAINFRNRFGM